MGQWLFWLIIALAAPVALLPTPSHLWYYIPVIPFYILCIASILAFPEIQISYLAKYALLLIALLGCYPAVKDIEKRGDDLFDRSYWTPLIVQDRSKRVDALLEKAGVTGKIATLSPDKLIKSNHGLHLQLATGPFFYRVASYMSPEAVERLHGASADTLAGLLEHACELRSSEATNAIWMQPFLSSQKPTIISGSKKRIGKGILYIRQVGTPGERSPLKPTNAC